MKNIFILVGERSADIHAAEVIKHLQKMDPGIELWGIGGKRMQEHGFDSIFPFKKFCIMGFIEVLTHLFFIMKVIKKIKKELKHRKPDLVMLVDYPGLNMRIGKIAHAFGIPVLYYISPQVWAWKKKRIHTISEIADKIAVIFPFEKELYEEVGGKAEFVGHPITEEINITESKESFARNHTLDLRKKWLGFIPGSRDVEIKRILPTIVTVIRKLDQRYSGQFEFLLSKADTVTESLFNHIISPIKENVHLIHDSHALMKYCTLVICKSGTSTLETAYLGTPMIVVYKVSCLSYLIARAFIKIRMISLANIVLDSKVVPELIQNKANPDTVITHILQYLNESEYYTSIKKELENVKRLIGSPSTSERVASIALEIIDEA